MQSPGGMAIALVVMAAASELKFRRRSADLALSGSVDAQIILEIAVWIVVVGLVVAGNMQGGRIGRRSRGTPIGPGLRLLVLISGLGFGSAVVTGGPLALVRSVQFAAVMAVAIMAYHGAKAKDDRGLVHLWLMLRRAMVLFAVTASVATLLWPTQDNFGTGRYAWFEVHAIATGGMLGIAVIMAATALFGTPDPWLRSRGRWTAYGVVVAALMTLIVLTGSRGAMAGTLAGVITAGALSVHARRRGIAILGSLFLGGLMTLGYGIEAIVSVAVRGQTTAQLLSLTGRTELFGIAYELFLERPWLGYGFLSGRDIFLERVPWAGEAHNMFVEIAISLGVVGLLLYVALFGWLLRVVIGATVRPPTVAGTAVRDVAGLLTFVLVAGMVTSGAAGLPGMQWLALVATVIVADCWQRNRRQARDLFQSQVPHWLLRQRRSITSA